MEIKWESCSDDIVLRTAVKALGINLRQSRVHPWLEKVLSELKAKGLKFKPHFWIGDEWFSPSGIPGVSIPFGLLHPRLVRLERKFVGFIEGSTEKPFCQLLRHEIGHAIETAYKLDKHPLRLKVFGDPNLPYPNSYDPKKYSRAYVRHLPDNYAQAHPDEDFAETFAVWLNPESQWKSQYEDWPAQKKLLAMEALMSEIKGQPQIVKSKREFCHYREVSMSLMAFYKKRARYYRTQGKSNFDQLLRETFVAEDSGQKASVYIKGCSGEFKDQLSALLGLRLYQIDRMIAQLSMRADQLNLYFDPKSKLEKSEFLDFMAQSSLELLSESRHRIIM